MDNSINTEITFFCKGCKKEFTIKFETNENYWNYNCPDCGAISPRLGFTGWAIKGCPNTRR